MIRPFDGAGNPVPLTYNGYTLNSVTRTEEGETGTRLVAAVASTALDYISENRQWADGIEVYNITKQSIVWQLSGIIHGYDVGSLMDGIKSLAHAFDGADIAFNNDDPFLPMTFTVPFTTPVPSKYFLLPVKMPQPVLANSGQGYGAKFTIPLLAKDPRRYAQTPVTQSGNGTLQNSSADYRSYPTIVFTMSGAGNAAFTVSNTSTRMGAQSIVFDLSGRSNGQVITLDFQNRLVKVNGTKADGIFVSGYWFDIEPGNNVIAYTNTGNSGTKVLTAYPAFSY